MWLCYCKSAPCLDRIIRCKLCYVQHPSSATSEEVIQLQASPAEPRRPASPVIAAVAVILLLIGGIGILTGTIPSLAGLIWIALGLAAFFWDRPFANRLFDPFLAVRHQHPLAFWLLAIWPVIFLAVCLPVIGTVRYVMAASGRVTAEHQSAIAARKANIAKLESELGLQPMWDESDQRFLDSLDEDMPPGKRKH